MVASTGTDSVRAGLPLYHPSAFVDRDYSFGRCCRDTALTSDAAAAFGHAPLRSLRWHICRNATICSGSSSSVKLRYRAHDVPEIPLRHTRTDSIFAALVLLLQRKYGPVKTSPHDTWTAR